jgi:hypothetical protein
MQINQTRRHQLVLGINDLSAAVRRNIGGKGGNDRILDGKVAFRPQVLAWIQDLAALDKQIKPIS